MSATHDMSDSSYESQEECISVVQPAGYQQSTCGYCSSPANRSRSPKSSKSYGTIWPQMSVRVYQELIDAGWRRSGDYVYHPDMRATCCPQYTIRLDALEFKADKKQRKALAKWNRYVVGECSKSSAAKGVPWVKDDKGKKANTSYNFTQEVHSSEAQIASSAEHKFEVTLAPAAATAETYALYKRYQMAIHGDTEEKVSPRGFSRFLCQSPLAMQDVPYTNSELPSHLPKKYGSYHQLYRVDGKLVAIGVIDILPQCVSSVYLIWDPDWAWASLGKISALHEIALARDMACAGAPGMQYLYMDTMTYRLGFYIHSCQKMRYKGEYQPSYLLDPGTNVFHPLERVTTLLEHFPRGYHPFSKAHELVEQQQGAIHLDQEANGDAPGSSSDSEDEDASWPAVDPPSFVSPASVDQTLVAKLAVLSGEGIIRPFKSMSLRNRLFLQPAVSELVAALGPGKIANVDPASTCNTYLYFG